jgi:hypothetical protein
MSAHNIVDNIKLDLSNGDWNEVSLAENKAHHRVEHKYHGVSKKLIMKLLNASKPVSISDFDGWIREENDSKQGVAVVDCVRETWWDTPSK